jgi:hypothetical protein
MLHLLTYGFKMCNASISAQCLQDRLVQHSATYVILYGKGKGKAFPLQAYEAQGNLGG